MKMLVLALLRAYQTLLRPALPPCCRFHPSCSEYAAQCVARFGAPRGLALTAKRLWRCHPLSSGGLDPVPENP